MTTDRFQPLPSQEQLDSEQEQMNSYLRVSRRRARIIRFKRLVRDLFIIAICVIAIVYLGAKT